MINFWLNNITLVVIIWNSRVLVGSNVGSKQQPLFFLAKRGFKIRYRLKVLLVKGFELQRISIPFQIRRKATNAPLTKLLPFVHAWLGVTYFSTSFFTSESCSLQLVQFLSTAKICQSLFSPFMRHTFLTMQWNLDLETLDLEH